MLNWFDIVVGVLFIAAVFNGFRKGLIMQLSGLITILLAAVFSGKLAKIILPELMRVVEIKPNHASVISYIIAFLLIAVGIFIIGSIIQKLLKTLNLNFINRLFGGIIAAAIAMVVMSILLNLILILDTDAHIITMNIRKNSFFYERVRVVVPSIVPYLNEEVWEEYIPEKYKERIEQTNKENKEENYSLRIILFDKNRKLC